MGPSSVSVSPALLVYVCRVFLCIMSCNQWPYMKLTAIAKYPSRSYRRLLLLQTCARSHQRITLQSEAQTVRTQPSCLVDYCSKYHLPAQSVSHLRPNHFHELARTVSSHC